MRWHSTAHKLKRGKYTLCLFGMCVCLCLLENVRVNDLGQCSQPSLPAAGVGHRPSGQAQTDESSSWLPDSNLSAPLQWLDLFFIYLMTCVCVALTSVQQLF